MVKYTLVIASLIGFLVTLYFTPLVIKYMRRINLLVKDQNKKNTPLVPISGGFAVLTGLLAGLMFTIFILTFYFKTTSRLVFLLAASTSILIITFVGFIDDLLIRKSKLSSSGLRQWQKPLLTLAAAVPLMVVNAGTTHMWLPFFGNVDFGVIYPLFFIPLIVVGAANMVNMLAGFNGMETGMGIIYTFMLGLYAYVNYRENATVIAVVTLGALIAFYYYNKYPARILPGDSFTYLLGGVFATIAIIGNIEKAAFIAAIPFFIEFILKARGKFEKQTIGYWKNGKVKSKYEKVYSIPHLLTRTGRFTEKQIVYFMMFIELIFSSLIWFV